MECREFREVADSYLSDELLVETNHDVIAHLEACADCRRELAARRELRLTLRSSFANTEELRIDEQFAANLRTDLLRVASTASTSPSLGRRVWMSIAACVLLAASLGLIVFSNRRQSRPLGDRQNPNHAEASPATTPIRATNPTDASLVLAEISTFAAGDHRDCAINHRLPQRPIDLEEAGRKHDPAYLNLTKTVMSNLSNFNEPVELVMAHSCVFNGRWFGHVVIRYRGRLASLLVTRLVQTDELTAKQAPTGIAPEAQVIACSRSGGFQISCFRTMRHAIFVVSDLEETENLTLARRLAPPVYEHVVRSETVT